MWFAGEARWQQPHDFFGATGSRTGADVDAALTGQAHTPGGSNSGQHASTRIARGSFTLELYRGVGNASIGARYNAVG